MSLIACQALFELGLTYTINQYIAHEVAGLRWTDTNTLAGDSKSLIRVSNIIVKGVGAYSIISVIFFMAVSFAGTLFFGRREEYNFMEHGLPWIILVLSTSIKLTITGFEAALEGAGRVSKVAKKRAISNLIYAASIWLFVLYEFKLMAISLGSLISVIFLSIYYLINYKSFIAQQLSLYYGKNGNKNAVSRRY